MIVLDLWKIGRVRIEKPTTKEVVAGVIVAIAAVAAVWLLVR